MLSQLLEKTLPNWFTDMYKPLMTVLLILVTLGALAIIVAVLIQPSNPDGGANAITGKNESYYGYNKSDTKEGRLHKMIIICSAVVLVLSIVCLILSKFYEGGF